MDLDIRAEQNNLWRKVIKARYEGNSSSLLPHNVSATNKSWIWRNIVGLLSKPANCFQKNIAHIVGNGRCIQFWSDIWIGNRALKDSHPRIFALSKRKSGAIADFGRNREGCGHGLSHCAGIYSIGRRRHGILFIISSIISNPMLRSLMGLDGMLILMAYSHQKHISITRPSAQDQLMESGSKCGQVLHPQT
ncbi:hypothetical protein GQ457_04G021950 [Hibiscus cannabinus]